MEELSFDTLKPYENNAKDHPDRQIRDLAKHIQKYGFDQPVVVDKNFVIIKGHGRRLACQKLEYIKKIRVNGEGYAPPGADWIPVTQYKNLSIDDADVQRLFDNKINESPWMQTKLIAELERLNLKGIDIQLAGFSQDILSALKEDDFNAEAEYNKINIPKTKPGDIYKLGDHRMMCGDSTKIEDFQKLMDGVKGNMIFTDPPYAVDYHSPAGNTYHSKKFGGTGGKIFNDDMSEENAVEFFTKTLQVLKEVTEDDVSIYWWFANKNNYLNRQAFIKAGWYMSQIIVWVKNSMIYSRGQDYHRQYEPCMFGWKEKKKHYTNRQIADLKDVFTLEYNDFKEAIDSFCDVWFQKRDVTNQYVHPTQKPVKLVERALKKNSKAGDIVIDAFLGSGSTMIGCQQMQRRCYGMELDPKYCDVIVKRWESFTGQKSVLVTKG